MYVKNRKFLILGVSKSGIAAAKYLLGRNADFITFPFDRLILLVDLDVAQLVLYQR